MKVKRFLVFGFYSNYPEGGWNDLVGSFDTVAEARAVGFKRYDIYQIVDLETGEIS